jgi:hypothetical protein
MRQKLMLAMLAVLLAAGIASARTYIASAQYDADDFCYGYAICE